MTTITYRLGASSPVSYDDYPSMMVLSVLKEPNHSQSFSYDNLPTSYNLYQNDIYELSPVAQLANLFIITNQICDGVTVDIYENQVFSFYQHATGYEKNRAWVDRTASLPSILTYAMCHGFPYSKDFKKRAIPKWGWIDHRYQNVIKNTLEYIGPVYASVILYMDDKTALTKTKVDIGINDRASGIWGYTCVLILGYHGIRHDDTVTVLIWDRLYTVTWQWLYVRLCETYGVVFSQYSNDVYEVVGEDYITFTDQLNDYTVKGMSL